MNPSDPSSLDPSTDTSELERSPRSLPPSTGPSIAGGGTLGAVAGAAVAAGFGPPGLAVGAIVGAVTGSLAGKGLAESTTPTDEAQYWLSEHDKQPWAKGRPYEVFVDAYKVGYQGWGRSRTSRNFANNEARLRREYEEKTGPESLPWEEARVAAEAAWNRLAHREESLIDTTVLDEMGEEVGRVHTLWRTEDHRPLYAGVTTTWLLGKMHVVPLFDDLNYDADARTVRLPYSAKLIREAPTVNPAAHLTADDQTRVCLHFGTTVASVAAENMTRLGESSV